MHMSYTQTYELLSSTAEIKERENATVVGTAPDETGRPGQIKEIVEINLPRPRFGYDVKKLPEYGALRDHIWRLVKDEAFQAARGEKR